MPAWLMLPHWPLRPWLVGRLFCLGEACQVGTLSTIACNPKSSAQHPVVSQQGERPGSAYVQDWF